MARNDPSLVQEEDGGYRNRAGKSQMHFARDTNDPTLVRVSSDKWSIAFGMRGAKPGRLAKKRDKQTVAYESVAEDADLEFSTALAALKESIVLRRRPQGDGEDVAYAFDLVRVELAGSEIRYQSGPSNWRNVTSLQVCRHYEPPDHCNEWSASGIPP
jgi:hypothetical protein